MVQYAFELDDIQSNIARAETICIKAAEQGAKVVVFPEAAPTGRYTTFPVAPICSSTRCDCLGPKQIALYGSRESSIWESLCAPLKLATTGNCTTPHS